MPEYTLLPLDCRQAMRLCMPPESVDSVVTDPPYDLISIHDRFKKVGRNDKTWSKSGPHQRTARGFMNQLWDGTAVAFDPDTWREVWRVLKPGGHLFAFGGTRTYHLMVCAIEDAGFEIRDQFGWAYGSGFPKSHDVSKAIDRMAGAERTQVAARLGLHKNRLLNDDNWSKIGDEGATMASDIPVTPEAQRWQGWGTAVKPAWEPIVLARKPLIGSVARNVLAHGTGALNIDACRIGTEAAGPSGGRGGSDDPSQSQGRNYRMAAGEPRPVIGRFPANLMHDGSPEVLACFPETTSGGGRRNGAKDEGIYGAYAGNEPDRSFTRNSGSAARFFFQAKWENAEWLDQSLPGVSASIADGCLSLQNLFGAFAQSPVVTLALQGARVSLNIQIPAIMSVTLLESKNLVETLIGAMDNIVCAFSHESRPEKLSLSLNNVQFVAEATPTAIILTIPNLSISSGFVGLVIFSITPMNWEVGERDCAPSPDRIMYCAKASKADRDEGCEHLAMSVADTQHVIPRSELDDPRRAGTVPRRNHHPTVKPTALMEWLVRLVTPPGGLVLDPFTGSGSTGKAALRQGFSFIGCEMTPEYIPIAEARLAHALAWHEAQRP